MSPNRKQRQKTKEHVKNTQKNCQENKEECEIIQRKVRKMRKMSRK